MAAASPTASAPAAPVATRSRTKVDAAWLTLTALIGLAAVARILLSALHSTPSLFPDEYIYAELGRSLADGSLTIRDQRAAFPALFEPLLASPLWGLAGDDVATGYRLVQALHAVAASLTAVPVFLLARRLQLSTRASLTCAALALALPAMVFTSYITADVVALPLVIGAVTAGVAALTQPSARAQAAFLGLAGLATFTRVQYVVLPAAFVVGMLVVERGSIGGVLRTFRVTVVTLTAGLVAASVVGLSSLLGYYRDVTTLDVRPGAILHWFAVDSMLLAYAAGIVLVPAAVVGLVAGLWHPRSRAELAFAALTAALAVLLLLEATVYASNGSERFQERYLVALLPLVPVLFCLGIQRVETRVVRLAVMAVAAALFVVAAVVPLSGYTGLDAKQDSPLLQAVYELERLIGVGNASLVVSAVVAALTVLAAGAAAFPRVGGAVCLAAAMAALLTVSAGALRYDIGLNDTMERTFVAEGDRRWVDTARLDDVAILQTPYSSRMQISSQLFWNTSLRRILQLPNTEGVDKYGSTPTRIASDGRILADGETVTSALLVQEYASWASLDDARLLRRTVSTSLWQPRGVARMAVLHVGRYLDGWLGARNELTIWPRERAPRSGILRLTLSLPTGIGPATLDLVAPGIRRAVRVPAGGQSTVSVPFEAAGPWRLVLRPRRPFALSGGRLVAVRSAPPIVVEAHRKKA